MTHDEILASLTWHFMVGNDEMTPGQWAQHKDRAACDDCQDKTLEADVVAIDGMHSPGPAHPVWRWKSEDP